MWFKSTGIIRYDPIRPGLKKKTEWWCIVTLDKEITRYFRYWVMNNPCYFGETRIDLKQPSWDAHISVIRGEKPKQNQMHLWKKYNGERVEFEYSFNVRRSGDTTNGDRPDNYFFVEVRCPRLMEIREEFGFPTHWKLHMTIGRTWEYE